MSWAARKAPEDFRSWWRHCTRLATARMASHNTIHRHAEFVELLFWMTEHGLDNNAYTAREKH